MTTTEKNKLIAEFMGYTQPHPDYPNATYWYKEGEAPLAVLLYDTNWEWLMPVIEKIYNISFKMNDMAKYYYIAFSIPDRRNTYNAVVEFINYYNQNYDNKYNN